MTEKELIAKIKELRQIKPRKDWVVLVKERILSEEPDLARGRASVGFKEMLTGLRFILGHKLAFSTLTAILVLIGVFGFAQGSLPGDFLYSVKKVAEGTETLFTPPAEQLQRNLEIANKRLDELTKIAQTNSVKNLAPAINEVQASVSKAAKNLKEIEPDTIIISEVKEIKEIEEKTIKIRSLGIEIGGNEEFDSALVERIKNIVDGLEAETLTEEQVEILKEVKEKIEEEKYAEAWEKILTINN